MTSDNPTNSSLRALTTNFAQAGQLNAIYCRPARGIMCVQNYSALAIAGRGLQGDRTALTISQNPLGSNRQITLIQAEHIAVIAALMNKRFDPALLRRNLVISGINLLAAKSLFKDQPMHLMINDVILEVTGLCEPCSKMEVSLGHGAYNALRGHGGVTARVIKGGELKQGDYVSCSIATSAVQLQKSLF